MTLKELPPRLLPMRLSAYIEAVDGSEAAFARRAGVDQKTIWSLVRGKTTPRGDTIRKIIAASQAEPAPSGPDDGVVRFEDLFVSAEDSAA